MAIQVSGTTVVDDSRNLTNIASVDATTVAAIGAAGVGGGGTHDFVASGAIANGDVVSLNSDGTVSVTGFADPSVGSPSTFTNGNPPYKDVVFDSLNNKVVVVYMDGGNFSYGTAVVGTVSGSSISFGTPVVFNSAQTQFISATFDTTNNKVVVAYKNDGNSAYGTAIVGTVSGSSISFGSPTVFNSAATTYTSCTFDTTNNKVVVAYRNGGNSNYGTAIVGTVSGTSISFGTAAVYETAESNYNSAVFDSNNNKIVIAYCKYVSSTTGEAVVGTVSGTSISFGTPVNFDSAEAVYTSAAFDSNNNKIVIAYYGSSGNGKALVGTVSGTSISFGTTVTFSVAASTQSTTFDESTGKVVVAYQYFPTGKPYFIVGTVSGTSISFGTEVQFNTPDNGAWIVSTYDSNSNKVVIAYQDQGSNIGKAVVVDSGASTAPDYIGVAAEAISDTATGEITIIGGVNEGQTGLTIGQSYFVADDGTLTTTNNGRKIGEALSATELQVKMKLTGGEMNEYLGGLV